MSTFLPCLTIIAMIATGGVLVWGLVDMVRGRSDRKQSTKLMRYRVLLQGAALVLFSAIFYFGR